MARHVTQLSLDEEQYQALAELAEDQRRTVPDLVGELIGLGLEHLQQRGSRKREALAQLGSLRRDLRARIGVVTGEPVAEARQVREQQRNEILDPARVR